MKIRLQIIGIGGAALAVVLMAAGAIALHSDAAIISGGVGFVCSTILKTIGDLIKD